MSLRKLFLLDGLGAVLSAVLLGVVLIQLQTWVGIPISTLYLLAVIPCLIAVCDFFIYFKVRNKLPTLMKILAVTNVMYCLLSVALGCLHFQQVTLLGWIYIVVEVIIVLALAAFEWRAARKEKPGMRNSG